MDKKTEIKELRDKADKLEAEQLSFDALAPEYKLAEAIHEKFCHWNHTDGCGWHYESWTNIGHARGSYLEKANAILKDVEYSTAELVIKNL